MTTIRIAHRWMDDDLGEITLYEDGSIETTKPTCEDEEIVTALFREILRLLDRIGGLEERLKDAE